MDNDASTASRQLDTATGMVSYVCFSGIPPEMTEEKVRFAVGGVLVCLYGDTARVKSVWKPEKDTDVNVYLTFPVEVDPDELGERLAEELGWTYKSSRMSLLEQFGLKEWRVDQLV
jgi:hypothetical protein